MCAADLPVFVPDWQLPTGVQVLQTERGVGVPPFGGFNLGNHVGDDAGQVASHRQRLAEYIGATPLWLQQVHGNQVFVANAWPNDVPTADAVVTQQPGIACAILTADCLPVLIADRKARVVGAAHAGWRGLAGGVVEQLVAAMTAVPGVLARDLSVWLGPTIGPTAFEVGPEVVEAFVARDPLLRPCFEAHPQHAGKYLADIAALAVQILQALGIDDVTNSGFCTVSLTERFYSYRRDNVTGRMASLIWLS